MTASKQLWLLTGGNGAGKSTFYHLFLEPQGIKLVNADLIAKEVYPEIPEKASYRAANLVSLLLDDLLYQGISFCYKTVFSHETKIDFTARAKAQSYEIILVYIHLNTPELNEARIHQRVTESGHNVPADKIHTRIPRTMKNIMTILPLVNEARLIDNSYRDNPFQQIAFVKWGRRENLVLPLPEWTE